MLAGSGGFFFGRAGDGCGGGEKLFIRCLIVVSFEDALFATRSVDALDLEVGCEGVLEGGGCFGRDWEGGMLAFCFKLKEANEGIFGVVREYIVADGVATSLLGRVGGIDPV